MIEAERQQRQIKNNNILGFKRGTEQLNRIAK